MVGFLERCDTLAPPAPPGQQQQEQLPFPHPSGLGELLAMGQGPTGPHRRNISRVVEILHAATAAAQAGRGTADAAGRDLQCSSCDDDQACRKQLAAASSSPRIGEHGCCLHGENMRAAEDSRLSWGACGLAASWQARSHQLAGWESPASPPAFHWPSAALLGLPTPAGILQVGTLYAGWVNQPLANKAEYAARHGYGVHFMLPPDGTLPGTRCWPRWLCCHSMIGSGSVSWWLVVCGPAFHMGMRAEGWVAGPHSPAGSRASPPLPTPSVDLDTIIMTPSKPLTNYVDETRDVVLAHDGNGLNTGSRLIRNSAWSTAMLLEVYTRPEALPDYHWEQAAFVEVTELPGTQQHVKVVVVVGGG